MSNSPIRPFSDSLPMALLRARENVMRLFRPGLAAHGISEQQWRVLRALAAQQEACDVGQLAEATFLLGPSLSRIISNLADRDLLTREASLEDQRRTLIQITGSGLQVIASIGPTSEDIYANIEASVGAKELTALIQMLDDLAERSFES